MITVGSLDKWLILLRILSKCTESVKASYFVNHLTYVLNQVFFSDFMIEFLQVCLAVMPIELSLALIVQQQKALR